MPYARSLPFRFPFAAGAVPVVVAGLLLTGCGGGKPAATTPDGLPRGSTGAPVSGIAGSGGGVAVDTVPGGAIAASGAMPGGLAAASGAVPGGASGAMAAGVAVPVDAVTPVAATPAASVASHLLATRGIGHATGTPDTLTVQIGVSTQAASAKAALDANNAKANALLDLLRRTGVADKDLRTSQLTVNPVYDDKSSTITGYQVENTVQATLHDLSKAGALLDAAVSTVGNAVRIEQISFSVGDDTALRAQARAQAVAQAKAQAGQLAQAAGVSLGAVRSLTEVVDGGSPVTYDMKAAAGASAASVPVQPGQQEITVAVDLVYDIG